MMKNLFKVYDDAGHGWLRVPHTLMAEIGMVKEDVSIYSYRDENYAYLEEDCDLMNFARPFCQEKNITRNEFHALLETVNCGNHAWIRDLPSYR